MTEITKDAPAGQPLIRLVGIAKSYGGVHALSGVNLDLFAGEIHSLCGENGAGKSTLIKTLGGSIKPDRGEIFINGRPTAFSGVRASEAAGIGVIHQELVAFPHLDIPDNIFMGREPRRLAGLYLDRRRMLRESAALLESLGEPLELRRSVGGMSVAQQQMVGIARALSQQCRVLIMDEPTASLSERETATLFRMVRQLRQRGVAILYVSHRMDEIFALSDRISVLRNGAMVGTFARADIDQPQLIRLMVGRELAQAEAPGRRHASTGPVLAVRGLTKAGFYEDISLTVGAGEIVGMAGLIGAGRSDVAKSIFGLIKPDSGDVEFMGAPLPHGSVRQAMRRGMALAPEDRQHAGLVLPMTVEQNLSMAALKSVSPWGITRKKKERALAARMVKDLSVKTAAVTLPARSLSGGNQQKLVLGKWLARTPKLLILDEPTRGVDVGAKAEIYQLIRRLAADGMAVLMISSDLPEVLSLSDRILVMRQGRISGELPAAGATQEDVLKMAMPDAPQVDPATNIITDSPGEEIV